MKRTVKEERIQVAEELKIRRSRRDLLSFISFTKPDYQINWHHRKICDALNDFAFGRIKRMMVFTAPRHGKSEIVSRRLPAFLLGINPDCQIISASYSQPLAERLNRDVQRILDTKAYGEIFPDTKLWGSNVRTMSQGSWLRNADVFEVVGRKGMYLSAGVGGSITGFGANIAIIDDATKSAEESESRLYRERLHEWYSQTLYTRLEKDAQILITQTRWHSSDLPGHILQQSKADGNKEGWVVLSFPAICEKQSDDDPRKEGEALWPEKYNEKALEAFKRNLGSRAFAALYQQRPTELEGGIIKRNWFKFFIHPPDIFDQVISSWDTSFKKTQDGSFVVGQVWGGRAADRFLLYQVRRRMDFPETVRAIQEVASLYPKCQAHLIEDKANGSAILSTLSSKISGMIPVKPDASKESRLSAVSAQFEAGNVYIPDPSNCSWSDDYVDEICTFPNAPQDDCADCTSQALDHMRSQGGVGLLYAV